jgi:hypothetical protein
VTAPMVRELRNICVAGRWDLRAPQRPGSNDRFLYISPYRYISNRVMSRLFAARAARERIALLKALPEQPGENAAQILDVLHKRDPTRAKARAIEERRNWTDRGIILTAFGVGVAEMPGVIAGSGVWSVCPDPLLGEASDDPSRSFMKLPSLRNTA